MVAKLSTVIIAFLMLATSAGATCQNGCPNQSGIGASVTGSLAGANECIVSTSPTTAQWIPCPFTVPYDYAYDFGQGVLANGEATGIASPRAASIPANLYGSLCTATAAATGSSTFTITRTPYGGSPTTIATLTFGVGSYVCNIASTQAAVSINERDTIIVTGPATADATLAGVRLTIRATTTDYP